AVYFTPPTTLAGSIHPHEIPPCSSEVFKYATKAFTISLFISHFIDSSLNQGLVDANWYISLTIANTASPSVIGAVLSGISTRFPLVVANACICFNFPLNALISVSVESLSPKYPTRNIAFFNRLWKRPAKNCTQALLISVSSKSGKELKKVKKLGAKSSAHNSILQPIPPISQANVEKSSSKSQLGSTQVVPVGNPAKSSSFSKIGMLVPFCTPLILTLAVVISVPPKFSNSIISAQRIFSVAVSPHNVSVNVLILSP